MSKNKKQAMNGVMEYKEYEHLLNAEEKEYIKQFYDEYHGGNAAKYEEPILTAKEHIKEANRNYNALYKDAFNVTRTLNIQEDLTENARLVYELAADDNDFETAFSQIGDEAAMQTIMDQAVRDIEAGQDLKVVLSRFHVKMIRLKKLMNEEKRKQR